MKIAVKVDTATSLTTFGLLDDPVRGLTMDTRWYLVEEGQDLETTILKTVRRYSSPKNRLVISIHDIDDMPCTDLLETEEAPLTRD